MCLIFDIIAIQHFKFVLSIAKLVQKIVGVFGLQFFQQDFYLIMQLVLALKSLHSNMKDIFFRRVGEQILVQVSHCQVLGLRYRPRSWRILAHDHFEQCSFSGTVGPDQANFFSRFNMPVGFIV